MQPTLTWVDLTANDRDKMRRVLDLFNEKGTLDEMGLGNLRDTVSDALFPGTSYIQTRLRYVLFIPWIYQRLEDKRVSSPDVEQAARRAEVDLIRPLERSEDTEGIIGVVARDARRWCTDPAPVGIDIRDSWPTGSSSAYSATRHLNLTIPSRRRRDVDYAIRMPANRAWELESQDILFCPPARPSRPPLVRYKSFRNQAAAH